MDHAPPKTSGGSSSLRKAFLKMLQDEREEKARSVPLNKKDLTPWMNHTQWPHHIEGRMASQLCSLVDVPGQGNAVAAQLKKAVKAWMELGREMIQSGNPTVLEYLRSEDGYVKLI
jgi:hypothetical protein